MAPLVQPQIQAGCKVFVLKAGTCPQVQNVLNCTALQQLKQEINSETHKRLLAKMLLCLVVGVNGFRMVPLPLLIIINLGTTIISLGIILGLLRYQQVMHDKDLEVMLNCNKQISGLLKYLAPIAPELYIGKSIMGSEILKLLLLTKNITVYLSVASATNHDASTL